jgi:hypothetical protein
VRKDRLRNFASDGAQRVKRHQRILEHEADLAAAHRAPGTRRKAEQVDNPAVVTDDCHRTCIYLRLRSGKADQGTGRH